jgi:hypothetical protein
MTNITKIALLLTLAACGAKQTGGPVQERTPKTWYRNDYRVCNNIKFAPGVASLPHSLGLSTNRTDLPFGHYDGMSTRRSVLINKNLSLNTFEGFADNTGTVGNTFNGFSADGVSVYVTKHWKAPQWGMWEEMVETFDFSDQSQFLYDVYKVDLNTAVAQNLTGGLGRVSTYNAYQGERPAGGIIFNGITQSGSPFYTSIGGVIAPFTGEANKVAYGFKTSADGQYYAFHKSYKVYVGVAATGVETEVVSGFEFNFVPRFSPDSTKVMFWCGTENYCVFDIATTGVSVVAAKNGYVASNPFIDSYDYHHGGSDSATWDNASSAIIHGANHNGAVEIFKTSLNGTIEVLTNSPAGAVNYEAKLSPDGTTFVYISMRNGQRNLYLLDMVTRVETQLTEMEPGCGMQTPIWGND